MNIVFIKYCNFLSVIHEGDYYACILSPPPKYKYIYIVSNHRVCGLNTYLPNLNLPNFLHLEVKIFQFFNIFNYLIFNLENKKFIFMPLFSLPPSNFFVLTYCSFQTPPQHSRKDGADISIGSLAYDIVTRLQKEKQDKFYKNIRRYYLQACTYIVQKFPLCSDIFKNADVASLSKIEEESFEKIRFFVKKFPFLLSLCKKESETETDILNRIQEEFGQLQAEDLSGILKEDRADLQL